MLRKRGHGSSIDAHAAVWRVNQAPTVGYQADVGAATAQRLLNTVWAGNYVHHPAQPQLLADLQVCLTTHQGGRRVSRFVLPVLVLEAAAAGAVG
jgi:hypothetical protein